MKFLIQGEYTQQLEHDFSFTLLHHIKEHNFFYPNDKILYTVDSQFRSGYQNYIPVGSVEFVCDFIDRKGCPVPKPINIPDSLNKFLYLEREIYYGNENYMRTLGDKVDLVFVKSHDKIKRYNQVHDYTNVIPKGEYMYSQLINIASEWRGFVHKGELLDIRNYSGDPFIFPDIFQVKNMIRDYTEAPVAYTIDIAITEKEERTVLIEIHDFFSCGLYGFNHNKYPWMLSQWYHQYINKFVI